VARILTQRGDALTRENLMRQTANGRNLEPPRHLPWIKLNTSSIDYQLIESWRPMRFDGKQRVVFGKFQGG
jgi:branched-chain amino acid transport system substrate-binding protein